MLVRPARFLPLLLVMMSALEPAFGQSVRAYVLEDSITVGDRFTLVVIAEHPVSDSVAFPNLVGTTDDTPMPVGDLEVFGPRASGTRLFGPGHPYPLADSITYEATTFAIDTAIVAPIPVTFHRDGDAFRLTSASFFLPVASLVDPSSAGLRDLAPLAEFGPALWPWFLLLLVLAAAAAGYWYYTKRPKKPVEVRPPPPPPPPAVHVESAIAEARRRLSALESMDVDVVENVKPFFVELSEILRVYLERRLRVAAMETTSGELLALLRRFIPSSPIPDEVIEDVRNVLDVADLAKFAESHPTGDVSRSALQNTRAVINRIEESLRARRAPAPAGDPPASATAEGPVETSGENAEAEIIDDVEVE